MNGNPVLSIALKPPQIVNILKQAIKRATSKEVTTAIYDINQFFY